MSTLLKRTPVWVFLPRILPGGVSCCLTLFTKAPNTHEYSLDGHAASCPINFLSEGERAQMYGRLARTDEPTQYSINSPPLFPLSERTNNIEHIYDI